MDFCGGKGGKNEEITFNAALIKRLYSWAWVDNSSLVTVRPTPNSNENFFSFFLFFILSFILSSLLSHCPHHLVENATQYYCKQSTSLTLSLPLPPSSSLSLSLSLSLSRSPSPLHFSETEKKKKDRSKRRREGREGGEKKRTNRGVF